MLIFGLRTGLRTRPLLLALVLHQTVTMCDIANLSVISFQKLLDNDTEEASRLFSACSEWGFFCLDLASDEIEPYKASAARLQDFAVQYFQRPLEEKMQDTNDAWETFNICGYLCWDSFYLCFCSSKRCHSYKPRSLDSGNVEGKKDGCEGLRVRLEHTCTQLEALAQTHITNDETVAASRRHPPSANHFAIPSWRRDAPSRNGLLH